MPEFRPGTMDEEIWHHVVHLNEYRLPERFGPSETVLDIGGHIGSFVHAAVSRGAAMVHSYEAHPENFPILERNCRDFRDRVRLHRTAVWRSDGRACELFMQSLSGATGSESVFYAGKQNLRLDRVVGLDSIIQELTSNGRDLDLLKIDVEGAEYPILFTSQLLGRVREIRGEYHHFGCPSWATVDGFPEFNWAALDAFLRSAGFSTEAVHLYPTHGLFFAKRR